MAPVSPARLSFDVGLRLTWLDLFRFIGVGCTSHNWSFQFYGVVEKVVVARRIVIPAWLHSSGVDGGNPAWNDDLVDVTVFSTSSKSGRF